MTSDTKAARVLSIQAHAVRNYVGNKIATLPFQLLGHEVDCINTVSYTSVFIREGEFTSQQALEDQLKSYAYASLPLGPIDLENTPEPLPDVEYIISGYCPTSYGLNIIGRHIGRWWSRGRKENKPIIYICDPVLGDDGVMYNSPALIETYIKELFPIADIVTPNMYEAQWLTGIDIAGCLEKAKEACLKLHGWGPVHVIITSMTVKDDPDSLMLVGSTLDSAGVQTMFYKRLERFPVSIVGSGDLFLAMFVHAMDLTKKDVQKSAIFASGVMDKLLKSTLDADPNAMEFNPVRHRQLFLDEAAKRL